jgi:hypothetical protein
MDALEIWHEITLSAGVVAGTVAFFRGLEQRKDAAFAEAMTHLGATNSPVLRAGAARQLPRLHRYRRFFTRDRPYREQTLQLAVDALKVDQERFVRQALIESLQAMLRAEKKRAHVRLEHACLDELAMMGFDFADFEMTSTTIRNSGLEGANFARANLWRVALHKSNLERADFSEAKLWDADLSNTNLQHAILRTTLVNPNTRFAAAVVHDAVMSREVRNLCEAAGCDLTRVRVQ